jgi:dipeptidyl-peptidase 4
MEWTRPAAASASRTARMASVLPCFAACLIAGTSWLVPGAPPAAAQAAGSGASAALTVSDIMTGAQFRTHVPGDLRWLETPGPAAYSALEPSSDSSGTDIVRYDAASGARSVLVTAHQLTPSGAAKPLAVADYSWSADGKRLLIFTNTARVWRDNTRGDYWLFDRTSGVLAKLGGSDAKPSTLMFAKFSPDGGRIAYVRDNDLYVEDAAALASGHPAPPVRLTADGSHTTINGTSDWVYEEELHIRDCFRWSPDGKYIAYWQFDVSGVRDFDLIDDTDSLYSFVVPVQYPKAGTTNSAVRGGIVASTGGPTTWIQLPGDPRNNYLARLDWADNSSELVLQRLNRLQDTDAVMIANAQTGAAHTVLAEHDSAWVDVVNDLTWLHGGTEFLWESERDGWRHLYRVSRDGSRVTLITSGAYDVLGVQRIVESPAKSGNGWVYFTASPDNATRRELYRVRLDGKGTAERVTPANEAGTNMYTISSDGQWAQHGYSAIDKPWTFDIVKLPSHAVVRTTETNAALQAAVAPLVAGRPIEFFKADIGNGVNLDGYMIKPRDFDPAKRYPMLVFVYGEVAAQTVLDRWGDRQQLWFRWLADHGYVVASIDNRGTPAPKGRAWRKIVYGAVGELSSADQAAAVRTLTRTRSYLDSTRVGIWGWSGGGSNTLNCMFRYPDVFSVGMAVAPVPDERLYDTIYEERYMGLPQDNVDGYRRGSPISFADGLRGHLLIVHGSGDDNVHYQGTERLVNRLVALGKPFDLMVYPNRTHAIREGPGTTVHLYSLLTRYLTEHLPAGGRLGASAVSGQ